MRWTAASAVAYFVLTLVSCGPAAIKTVDIGVDDSPPFYIFQADGSVRGFAVDLLSEAARRRNIHIRWVPVRNISLDEALDSRLVQMWPAIGSTPDRKARLFVSEPWIETDYVLISPKAKPVRTVQEAAGKTISHPRLRGLATLAQHDFAKSTLIVLPDKGTAFQEMCLGRADAALLSSRVVEAMLLDRPAGCDELALSVAVVPGATTPLSIGAVPEAAPLARELRSEISKMAVEGKLGDIMDKWVPFSAETARSIGVERAEAVRNGYLALFSSCSLVCAVFLGLLAYRAHKLRQVAMAAEKAMRKQAAEDVLTRLPNRKVFTERVNRCIEECREGSQLIFGVFFLDLDSFKVINDSLGHVAGDQLLVEVARRLTETIRSSDFVGRPGEPFTMARFGGDEFVLLIQDVGTVENALRIADRIQSGMREPLLLDGHSVHASFSIGIALSSRDHRLADDILRDADTAMYAAKAAGKACFAVFDPAMRARAVARLEIETDLRVALSTSTGLVVHYQPQVNLANGNIVGFEALVRWQHPTHGLISPLDFIPIAEETGLIVPLGAWVLQQACRQIRSWRSTFSDFSNLRISVNLSGKQLSSTKLLDDVAQALQMSMLPPECLDLEITETFLLDNPEAAIQILLSLKNLGVGLQIDDFGTGYSSLSYLHRLPFDTLKIDRSFVQSMDLQEDGVEIIRTIMALAQGLKMNVVAEGVESQGQAFHLQQMGCGLAQGYLFSKPLDAVSAEKLLAARSRTSPSRAA